MITSTISITVLQPDTKGNWLRSGKTFSKKVFLGNEASADEWTEVPDTEYQSFISQQET